jgi:serine/threonine protein kinase
MNEIRTTAISQTAPTTGSRDRTHRDDGSMDEFVDEISRLLHAAPDSAWNAVAERYRRGEISAEHFRSIASTIVGRELATAHYGTTIDLEESSAPHSPTPEDHDSRSSTVEIGRVLRDRYVLEQRLGSGGMGTVFKALDRYRSDLPRANQYVAIKILHEKIENRPELLENLRREFYCTQMLSHRNVVKVYELDRDGDVDFFTMELLEGELLGTVMERLHPRPMSRAQAWAIIREIGSGLAHAHSRNVVHMDLKPHNIMITNAGEVRILDFGASSTSTREGVESVLRRRNTLSAVTPAYACCELLAGRLADPRDDIYAFACIAYELLAGSHPFQRRPSTVARDLGVVPLRPAGLTRQQWSALEIGLSWHRAGRSITVPAWLNKMNAERAAARQLPPPADLKPTPANARPTEPLRATTLFAALLFIVTAWLSFMHFAPGAKVNGGNLVPAIAADRRPKTDPAAPSRGTSPETIKETMQPAASEATETSTSPSPAAASPASMDTKHNGARSTPSGALPSPIAVTARNYRVPSGENFAEIRVHRSTHPRSETEFVWWTEAASAKPGVDYVPQGKVVQVFPKGRTSTSFFVKLVPTASRTQPEVFYIAIAEAGHGEAGHGAPSGQVTRAAVWLPTTHDHSYAMATHGG